MRVLVTGIDGYIGFQLGGYLLQRGYDVVGFDTGYYRDRDLVPSSHAVFPRIINKDLRNITPEDLRGIDAVCHLAEMSNDPLGEHVEKVTYKINHEGSVQLARLCKSAGIKKFIYTSSCSVYGVGHGEMKDEKSEVNPQTAYAHCKVKVEKDVGALADDHFTPVFFRNATAYGVSPRMRFDIVLNNLAGLAWTRKKIILTSDGSPWRPMVHILDICQALTCALEAPDEIIHNQVFNVGDTKENFQIRDIAQVVSQVFPDCTLEIGSSDGDNRSYRVSFDKINTTLPGFACRHTLESGAIELKEAFQRIDMPSDVFQFRTFHRLAQIKFLMETNQVDANLFWNHLKPR